MQFFAYFHYLVNFQYSEEKVLLLPTYMSKQYVYREYCNACQCAEKPISHRKFETLWLQLLPHITVMKPASDLCEVCHVNITMVMQSCNQPESVKSDQLKHAIDHLNLAM